MLLLETLYYNALIIYRLTSERYIPVPETSTVRTQLEVTRVCPIQQPPRLLQPLHGVRANQGCTHRPKPSHKPHTLKTHKLLPLKHYYRGHCHRQLRYTRPTGKVTTRRAVVTM